MKNTWKKATAFAMALALVAGAAPANVGSGGLFGNVGIVASAADSYSLANLSETANEWRNQNMFALVAANSAAYVALDNALNGATQVILKGSQASQDEIDTAYDTLLAAYNAAQAVLAAPAFSFASVTLADDLALNFYVDGVADDTAAAEYTVNFTGACVDESSALTYNAKEDKYYATTHVYAKDIDKDITATLCKGSDTIDTLEDYSITQYLSSPAFSEADEKTTALITATQNFGYASAEYFYGDDYGVADTFANYDPDVSAYATTFSSDDALLSLVLDSKTAARLYVKGDTTGTDSTFSATKAEYPTYHVVTGLLPQNLADEQTIDVGGTDYKFSALSWCYRVLNSTSASQKNVNMAKAIMAYYTAAKAYTTPNLADALVKGALVTVSYNSTKTTGAIETNTATFICNEDGTYTYISGTGTFCDENANGDLAQLLALQDGGFGYRLYVPGFEAAGWLYALAFAPAYNLYAEAVGTAFASLGLTFTGISVNNIDITDQLTKV